MVLHSRPHRRAAPRGPPGSGAPCRVSSRAPARGGGGCQSGGAWDEAEVFAGALQKTPRPGAFVVAACGKAALDSNVRPEQRRDATPASPRAGRRPPRPWTAPPSPAEIMIIMIIIFIAMMSCIVCCIIIIIIIIIISITIIIIITSSRRRRSSRGSRRSVINEYITKIYIYIYIYIYIFIFTHICTTTGKHVRKQ